MGSRASHEPAGTPAWPATSAGQEVQQGELSYWQPARASQGARTQGVRGANPLKPSSPLAGGGEARKLLPNSSAPPQHPHTPHQQPAQHQRTKQARKQAGGRRKERQGKGDDEQQWEKRERGKAVKRTGTK